MLSVDIIILEYSFVHKGQEECSIITRRGVQASSLSHGCTCYTCFDLGLQPSAPPPGFDLRLQPLGFTIRLRPYRSHVMHVLSRDSHPRPLRTSLFDQCPGPMRPGSHALNNNYNIYLIIKLLRKCRKKSYNFKVVIKYKILYKKR